MLNIFLECNNLTTITIGSGVKSIGSYAFALCENLKDVYCMVEETSSNSLKTHLYASSNAFTGSYVEYATLHVPASSTNAYITTEPWSSFKEVVALTDQELSVGGITNNKMMELDSYTIGGQRTNNKTRGLNIIRMSDGTMKKVVVK